MELPHIGKHCSNEYCNKLDFLPISCDACKKIFCSDHFSYVQHNCSKGAFKDNQVPVCPICMKPVPSVKGQEDRAVSEHMDKFCNTQTKIYLNSCSFQNCKKRELVPFSCSQCKLNFCLKHRHFDIHNCNTQRRSQAAQAAINRQNNKPEHFHNIQGTMSEDEALARALAASMQQEDNPHQITPSPATSQDKTKCALS